MSGKQIHRSSLVLVLGLVLTSAAHAADAGPVGWWKSDDASGSIAVDSSGRGNDGTLMGNAAWAKGHLGDALSLDGASWVQVPAAAWAPIEKQFTIAFWAFGSETLGNNWVFSAFSATGGRVAGCHIPWNGTVYFDTGAISGWERIGKAPTPEEYKG